MLGYLESIQQEYKFKQLLKEYVKYIPELFVRFNSTSYTYKFHSYPASKLSFEEIKGKICAFYLTTSTLLSRLHPKIVDEVVDNSIVKQRV